MRSDAHCMHTCNAPKSMRRSSSNWLLSSCSAAVLALWEGGEELLSLLSKSAAFHSRLMAVRLTFMSACTPHQSAFS